MPKKNEDKPIERVEDLFNRRLLERSIYAFGTGLALITVFFFFQNFSQLKAGLHESISLLTPFIWGTSIAYILMPLFNWLSRFLNHWSYMQTHPWLVASISCAVTMLIFTSLLALFFSMVIPEVFHSVRSLVTMIKNSDYQGIQEYLQIVTDQLATVGITEGTIQDKAPDSLMGMFENPDEFFNQAIDYILGILVKAGASVKNIVLAFIVSIYVMIGKNTFLAQSRKIVYACTTKERAEHFLDFCRRTNRIFSGFISGKILDSLIIGVICFIVMQILRLEYPVLISMIIGVTNVIPFFGPFIGAIPSILLLLIVSPKQALIFTVVVVVLQQFDGNILGPKILGGATGLTSFWVIFAVIFMGGTLGVVGMFIGVPIFATIYMIAKNTIERRLRRKKLPVATDEYRNI